MARARQSCKLLIRGPLPNFSADLLQPNKEAEEIHLPPPTGAPPPPPVHIDRNRMVTPGPWSATSRNSQDRLMSESPPQDEEISRPRAVQQRNSSSFIRSRNLTGQESPSSTDQFMSSYEPSHFNPRDSTRMSALALDDEAKLVLGYLKSGRKSPGYAPVPASAPSPPQHRKPVPSRNSEEVRRSRLPLTLYDGDNQDYSSVNDNNSITTTPKAHKVEPSLQEESLGDDLAFQEMARSAAKFEAGEHLTPQRPQSTGKKVMTPAEFQQYKEDKEKYRISSEAERTDHSDNSSVDDYDEDDEAERTAELTKQRRKQEAKLSVYRQQMMKVTGERNLPSLQPNGNGGSPGLTKRLSSTSLQDTPNAGGKGSADDDDDDIPLGILAAHGFPSKERPPSHLQRMSSQPNIRYTSETYPPPVPPMPGSNGQSLPVFARNLPKDPYYGASIVNPSVRESMGFNTGPTSVYGGSQAPGSNLPPGGLVGIIAKEERAKALRRGTPASNSFDATNQTAGLPLPPSMMPSMTPPMGMPSQQPLLSPDQQAQVQMNQQMTQMMQMQMQWMQQMMAMQGMQGTPSGQQVPQMPTMPMMQSMSMPQIPTVQQMAGPAQRQSTSGPGTPGGYLSVPNAGPRPMSNGSQLSNAQHQHPNQWQGSRASLSPSQMVNNRASQQSSQGYATSIAPSERSIMGQPSRYRPVSTAPVENKSSRASTMGTTALKAWESRPLSDTSFGGDAKQKAAVTVRPVVPKAADDEDEDEGWEEMRRKREGKRRLWKGKKQEQGQTGLEGVFYPTNVD